MPWLRSIATIPYQDPCCSRLYLARYQGGAAKSYQTLSMTLFGNAKSARSDSTNSTMLGKNPKWERNPNRKSKLWNVTFSGNMAYTCARNQAHFPFVLFSKWNSWKNERKKERNCRPLMALGVAGTQAVSVFGLRNPLNWIVTPSNFQVKFIIWMQVSKQEDSTYFPYRGR